jgi:ubiquinone/menaquinone biosynthesis C-methylase UbiE
LNESAPSALAERARPRGAQGDTHRRGQHEQVLDSQTTHGLEHALADPLRWAVVKPPNWYLDELAHAGPEHLDDVYVANYDRKAGFDPTPELSRLQALGLNETATLVDFGAGTGAMALAAARVCRRVVAVDVSAPMLDIARRRANEQELSNVECVRSGFLTYEHTGEPADFVYLRHALHQLPDFWKAIALERIAAVLRVGGVFRTRDLFLSCPLGQVHDAIESWLARASDQPGVGWSRAELETHLRDEYSTFTWLFEPMLVQAGFEVREAAYSDSRIYAEYSCVRVR